MFLQDNSSHWFAYRPEGNVCFPGTLWVFKLVCVVVSGRMQHKKYWSTEKSSTYVKKNTHTQLTSECIVISILLVTSQHAGTEILPSRSSRERNRQKKRWLFSEGERERKPTHSESLWNWLWNWLWITEKRTAHFTYTQVTPPVKWNLPSVSLSLNFFVSQRYLWESLWWKEELQDHRLELWTHNVRVNVTYIECQLRRASCPLMRTASQNNNNKEHGQHFTPRPSQIQSRPCGWEVKRMSKG